MEFLIYIKKNCSTFRLDDVRKLPCDVVRLLKDGLGRLKDPVKDICGMLPMRIFLDSLSEFPVQGNVDNGCVKPVAVPGNAKAPRLHLYVLLDYIC